MGCKANFHCPGRFRSVCESLKDEAPLARPNHHVRARLGPAGRAAKRSPELLKVREPAGAVTILNPRCPRARVFIDRNPMSLGLIRKPGACAGCNHSGHQKHPARLVALPGGQRARKRNVRSKVIDCAMFIPLIPSTELVFPTLLNSGEAEKKARTILIARTASFAKPAYSLVSAQCRAPADSSENGSTLGGSAGNAGQRGVRLDKPLRINRHFSGTIQARSYRKLKPYDSCS